jgi:hypothetical protein
MVNSLALCPSPPPAPLSPEYRERGGDCAVSAALRCFDCKDQSLLANSLLHIEQAFGFLQKEIDIHEGFVTDILP